MQRGKKPYINSIYIWSLYSTCTVLRLGYADEKVHHIAISIPIDILYCGRATCPANWQAANW